MKETVSASQLNKELSHLVLTPEGIQEINTVLREFVDKSESNGALLVEKSGQLISLYGSMDVKNTVALAALVGGAFASTKELGRLIGEDEFSMMYQQGHKNNILIAALSTHDLLVAVFDDKTSIGLVKVIIKQAIENLSEIVSRLRAQKEVPKSFKDLIESELDSLFG